MKAISPIYKHFGSQVLWFPREATNPLSDKFSSSSCTGQIKTAQQAKKSHLRAKSVES
jgi:hypothetical protein